MIGDLGFDPVRSGHYGADPAAVGRGVAECVLGQIHRAYPCYTGQVLGSPDDLSLPSDRYPAFFGSFDWHSCVHSHWALVRMLLAGVLDRELAQRCVDVLQEDLGQEVLAREAALWQKAPAHEELPYGMTWLLTLDAELARPQAEYFDEWREALTPMTALAAQRVRGWVDGLRLPARTGVHSDTAWSLAMAYDWAGAVGDVLMTKAIEDKAIRLFCDDVVAPVDYEPSAQTFTSPILNEAALMARVLTRARYQDWMGRFLPSLFTAAPETRESTALLPDAPGTWDGKNYYGVHEVALPLARCLAARDAAAALEEGPAREALFGQAQRWGRQGLADVTLSGTLADHWVGSFVVATVAL